MRTGGGVADWRAAADPEDLREYDRFGPWIDRVTEPVDMPRRFRPWWDELGGVPFLLKVPRDYDRAQVRPGMDLYRSVIAIGDERVTVLDADEREVARRDILTGDVVATNLYRNLLLGRWSLLLADGGSMDIEFNSVSLPVIAQADRFVRRLLQGERRHEAPAAAVRPGDHFFRAVAAELDAASDEPVRPVHVEDAGRLCRSLRGWRRRSAGMMLLASGSDLVIVNRDLATLPLLRRGHYASNIETIAFAGMTSWSLEEPEADDPPRFGALVITCGRQVVRQPLLDRPDGALAALAAHGVPRA